MDDADVRMLSGIEKERFGEVHCLVDGLGLAARVSDSGTSSRVAGGKFAGFRNFVWTELEALSEGGSCSFKPQSILDEKVIRTAASELGLLVSRIGESLGVRRPNAADLDAETSPDAEFVPATVEQQVAVVFNEYAGGHRGDNSVFLRKGDLRRFFDDAKQCGARRRAATRRTTNLARTKLAAAAIAGLEREFDNIVELQVDLGCRVSHGITRDYFQVFLSKAACELGWSLVSLLLLLLDEQSRQARQAASSVMSQSHRMG